MLRRKKIEIFGLFKKKYSEKELSFVRIHCLKYLKSRTLGCKKSEFVTNSVTHGKLISRKWAKSKFSVNVYPVKLEN